MNKICNKCRIEKEINEFYKERSAIYDKKYYVNNKEAKAEYSKEYRLNNKDIIKYKKKIYCENNKEAIRIKGNEYIKNRRKSDILFRIKCDLRNKISGLFGKYGYKKNSKTANIIGCSFEDFKIYLESKFENWMTWDNHGLYDGNLQYGWDMDHIIPLSTVKDEADIIKLNHYTNFQPLCSKVNRDIKKDSLTYKITTINP
jgi:hypothetical protein